MTRNLKMLVALGVAALVLSGAIAGVALAQGGNDGDSNDWASSYRSGRGAGQAWTSHKATSVMPDCQRIFRHRLASVRADKPASGAATTRT